MLCSLSMQPLHELPMMLRRGDIDGGMVVVDMPVIIERSPLPRVLLGQTLKTFII
jgi:hypothetical protein